MDLELLFSIGAVIVVVVLLCSRQVAHADARTTDAARSYTGPAGR